MKKIYSLLLCFLLLFSLIGCSDNKSGNNDKKNSSSQYNKIVEKAKVSGKQYKKDYFSKEKVERVIVGEPKQMDGTPSQSAEIINAFVTKFQEAFPEMSVERVDERFTSKMAFQTMIDSGLNKKQRQNKALVDEIAATIILQDYLRYKK